MATSQLAPGQGLAERRAESDKAYWLWRRRSGRLRLLASGAASWLLHGCLALVVLWGGESLSSKRGEPPRVDVVAAVGETMGAPGPGDGGGPNDPNDGLDGQPADHQAAKFVPDSLPSAVTDSLPKVVDLKLPGAEIVAPILGGNGGLIGGTESGVAGGSGAQGGGGIGTYGVGTGWTNTEFMAITGTGSRFVYVIDRSASMGIRDRLSAVKYELLASLSKLPPEAQFQIIFYNFRPEVVPIAGKSQRLLFATDSNKTLVKRHLESVFADGGTEHLFALRAALNLNPDVIFFLTDADDLRLHEVKTVTDLNRGRATIHAIEFAVGPEVDRENMLQKLAQSNGGTYKYLDVVKLNQQKR